VVPFEVSLVYCFSQPWRKLRSPLFVFKPALVGAVRPSGGSGDFKVTMYERGTTPSTPQRFLKGLGLRLGLGPMLVVLVGPVLTLAIRRVKSIRERTEPAVGGILLELTIFREGRVLPMVLPGCCEEAGALPGGRADLKSLHLFRIALQSVDKNIHIRRLRSRVNELFQTTC
jgi:hypothetical protein